MLVLVQSGHVQGADNVALQQNGRSRKYLVRTAVHTMGAAALNAVRYLTMFGVRERLRGHLDSLTWTVGRSTE
jgi:predicted LPLAT superfamily acyltransferase